MSRFAVVLLLLVQSLAFAQQQQPIPYSHKTHLSKGLQCKNCHTNKDPGEVMGIPATSVCMGCHQSIKTDSPAIQKLAAFAKENKPVPWVRIYELPGYVYFSHRVHIDAGANCQTCHGPVAERDVMTKEGDISMGACMDCHRKNKASVSCTYCHEARQ
jgi:hypothetical protein